MYKFRMHSKPYTMWQNGNMGFLDQSPLHYMKVSIVVNLKFNFSTELVLGSSRLSEEIKWMLYYSTSMHDKGEEAT